ncbi:unnamed protein product [Spodoptera littoralis]|uniref:Peptide chain release factor domain-containing protein n=1 Tax=Spodoptera littoralis TaxID=7109 RepID=A0A9P0I4V9_SPOLI|nr:unnamed protein product [Spodoptera littoralis]CAH1639871.1 unnamed protein product [Spodoptera littoralis]
MSKFFRVVLIRRIISTVKQNFTRKSSSRASINLSEPAIEGYLKRLMFEHEDLYMKVTRTPEESRRYFQIKPIVNVLQHRIALLENIASLKELIKTKYSRNEDDAEMKKMMKEESKIYEKRMEDLDRELQMKLVEPYLTEGVVLLEVKAESGGKEARNLAQKLFKMYKSYANYKDWASSVVSYEKSDEEGIIKGSMFIEGLGAVEFMKVETGIHSAKKASATMENGQNIQISTVAVTVLPKPTEEELSIPETDIIEEKLPDNFVRITHAPTGLVAECQENKSRTKNKHVAIQKLRTLLLEKQDQTSNCISEISMANGGQEVRTYDYLQDQVTEHRRGGGTVQNLQRFMQGNEKLEQVQENLLKEQTCQTLMDEINQYAAESVKN